VEIIIRKRDVYVCAIALLAFGAWVASAVYDTRQMRQELEALAEYHINDYLEAQSDPEGYDYLAIVDAEKAFTLFGRGWGIIHAYYRDKGDESFDSFAGIEYYYVRDKGEWKMTDSAGCGAYEHHIRAFDAYLNLGMDVPNRVYDRALGIDFAYDLDHLNASKAQ